jgi:hypothetical protein
VEAKSTESSGIATVFGKGMYDDRVVRFNPIMHACFSDDPNDTSLACKARRVFLRGMFRCDIMLSEKFDRAYYSTESYHLFQLDDGVDCPRMDTSGLRMMLGFLMNHGKLLRDYRCADPYCESEWSYHFNASRLETTRTCRSFAPEYRKRPLLKRQRGDDDGTQEEEKTERPSKKRQKSDDDGSGSGRRIVKRKEGRKMVITPGIAKLCARAMK